MSPGDLMRAGKLPLVFRATGLGVLSLTGVALVWVVARAVSWSVTWELWTVLAAIGTIGAALVALVLALRGWLDGRAAAARVVSAWVTD